MSALTDRIAAERRIVHLDSIQNVERLACEGCDWRATVLDGDKARRTHIAEVTEAAVREQVADAISATVITRDDQRRILNSGYGTEWVNGYMRGVTDAARIARRGVA